MTSYLFDTSSENTISLFRFSYKGHCPRQVHMLYHRSYLLQSFSCLSKDNYAATCHIFTAMIADTLYNCCCTGITYAETFTCHTVYKCFTAGSTVKRYVTDDNIFIASETSLLQGINNQFSTGKSFSEVIVGVTDKLQCQSFRDKCTKALSACTVTFYSKGVLFQRPSYFFVISEPKIVPKDLSVYLFHSIFALLPFSSGFKLSQISVSSFVFSSSKSYTCFRIKDNFLLFSRIRIVKIFERSIFTMCFCLDLPFFKRSLRPTSSSTVLTPSFAIYSRSSCAINA